MSHDLPTDSCFCGSVFQMFRFEVHLRITDEHIQHMDPPNSFLFSSLFDGDGGVMVSGSQRDSAEALLSSLRSEELCCGLVDDLVDDLVSRSSGKESGWTVDFHGDWSLFSSSGEASPQWSSEEDQNQTEVDSEESRALWESLSSCSDPYNPLFFSASFSTGSRTMGLEPEPREVEPSKVLVRRSDSEVSWSGSDSSGLSEESEKLLELFNSTDPYNPMCFTASTSPVAEPLSWIKKAAGSETLRPCVDPEKEEDEEWLWNSLCLQGAPPANTPFTCNQAGKPRGRKPRLSKTKFHHHSHPEQTWVPWKKPGAAESRKSNTGSARKQVNTDTL